MEGAEAERGEGRQYIKTEREKAGERTEPEGGERGTALTGSGGILVVLMRGLV